jgi:hypothetical protein
VSSSNETRVKGIAIRGHLMVLELEQGTDATKRVLELVGGAAAQSMASGAIAPGQWYPVGWYRALHEATHRVLGVDPSHSRHMGHEMVKAQLAGVSSFFAETLDPESLIRLGAKVFRTYYDRGFFRVLEWDNGRTLARWEDCYGFSAGIWQDVTGGVLAFLEATGAKNVRSELLAGGGNGDAFMQVEFRWR